MPKAEFKRINEEREEAGLPLYANPRNSGAGSLRQIDPQVTAGRKLSAWFYQLVEDGDTVATQSEALARLAALGFPVNPEHDAGPRHRGRHRLHRALAREAPRAPVRDRRRRGQGRPRRPAGAARDGQPGAALGDRLQVPAGAGRGLRRGHRPVRRTDRDADAGRAHDAGQGRRLDRRAGDPPQPRRGPAQGHPDRRLGRPPEGRRRHPRGRPPDRRAADRRRSASTRCRRRCPVCGTPVVQDEGAVRVYCPNTALPGAAVAGVRAFRRAAAGWTSRAPAGRSCRSSSSAGMVHSRADFFRLTVEDLEIARPVREEERREPRRPDRAGTRRAAAGARPQRPRHAAGRLADRDRPGRLAGPAGPARRLPAARWRRRARSVVRGGRGGAAPDRHRGAGHVHRGPGDRADRRDRARTLVRGRGDPRRAARAGRRRRRARSDRSCGRPGRGAPARSRARRSW